MVGQQQCESSLKLISWVGEHEIQKISYLKLIMLKKNIKVTKKTKLKLLIQSQVSLKQSTVSGKKRRYSNSLL